MCDQPPIILVMRTQLNQFNYSSVMIYTSKNPRTSWRLIFGRNQMVVACRHAFSSRFPVDLLTLKHRNVKCVSKLQKTVVNMAAYFTASAIVHHQYYTKRSNNPRPDTVIIQQAIGNLHYPWSYCEHLLHFGIETIDCLNMLIDGHHYQHLPSIISIGHLIMIRIQCDKILSINNGTQSFPPFESPVVSNIVTDPLTDTALSDTEDSESSIFNSSTESDTESDSDSVSSNPSQQVINSAPNTKKGAIWTFSEEQRLLGIIKQTISDRQNQVKRRGKTGLSTSEWQRVIMKLNSENRKCGETIKMRTVTAVKSRYGTIRYESICMHTILLYEWTQSFFICH